jgi:hypothetical protein
MFFFTSKKSQFSARSKITLQVASSLFCCLLSAPKSRCLDEGGISCWFLDQLVMARQSERRNSRVFHGFSTRLGGSKDAASLKLVMSFVSKWRI